MPRNTATVWALSLIASFVLASLGCEGERAHLDAVVIAAQNSTRPQVAQRLVSEFDQGNITFEASLIRAEELLEADDSNATLFAGAVLDFAKAIESDLPAGGEYEFFWRRIGRLAYNASHNAFERQDYAEADTLVLAGPKRWQRDSYWIAYPNHEILVAYSLAHQGDAKAGIRLLQRRTPTPDSYAEAIDTLVEIDRKLLRQRLRQGIEAEQDAGEVNQGG
ncbi:MAG: hypothetical protein ED559_01255 [Phycisphaera sp.]|nr:MAG: hypothetical protein ED559_01255 [Phycisphaera sp.]